MFFSVFQGILIPFLGTFLGAVCVFFLKNSVSPRLKRALEGFAGGIMTAAAFFSLLLPAIEESADKGIFRYLFVCGGFLCGVLFLQILDFSARRLHPERFEGMRRTTKLFLSVTLHNIPEGMAVGIVYAGYLFSNPSPEALAGAWALALGIALQNFPEGAIVSMPLRAEGMKKGKAFLFGALSGAVEPVAALITLAAAGALLPVMPFLLSFAAGNMIYVVAESWCRK